MISLPAEYTRRMQALLGDDYDSYLASFDTAPQKALHVNRSVISPEAFERLADFEIRGLPYYRGGYTFREEGLGNHPYQHAGMFYIQEPSAMSPVAAVDIDPHWRALDLCAAPGGKSSQLAMAVPEGLLVSNDPVMSRCRILTGNIERMGYRHVVTACLDVSAFSKSCPGYFDLTLADAPCSGEGMFRKDEGAIREWSPGLVEKCALRQREILEHAKRTLRPGGTLIYSTCTFSLEENEMNVLRFLRDNPEFSLVPCREEVIRATSPGIDLPGSGGVDLSLCRRFYPFGEQGGEGQFIAVMRKRDDGGAEPHPAAGQAAREDLSAADRKIAHAFLRDTLTGFDEQTVFRKGQTIRCFEPDFAPDFPMFSCGVNLGTVENGRLKPAHQLFSAMGGSFVRTIRLEKGDERLARYLRGETFPCEGAPEGWTAVLVDGVPLGGAKVVGGVAKNHYPKGLRVLG